MYPKKPCHEWARTTHLARPCLHRLDCSWLDRFLCGSAQARLCISLAWLRSWWQERRCSTKMCDSLNASVIQSLLISFLLWFSRDARRWLVVDSPTSPTYLRVFTGRRRGLNRRSSPTTSCASRNTSSSENPGSHWRTHGFIYEFWSSWYLRRLAIPNNVAPPKTMKKMTEPNVKSIPSDIIHLSFRPKWRPPMPGSTEPIPRHKCRSACRFGHRLRNTTKYWAPSSALLPVKHLSAKSVSASCFYLSSENAKGSGSSENPMNPTPSTSISGCRLNEP